MKLHSLELRNVRGISHLRFDSIPEKGVTVITGPNEAGKSTIADALRVGLQYPAKSKARDVVSLVPYGRDEFPQIDIEFSIAEYRLRLHKVFALGRASTKEELEILKPQPRKLAGAQATQFLNELTSSEGTNDLWNVFVTQQGQALKSLAVGGTPRVTNALQESSGGAAETSEELSLFEAIKGEYDKYFTEAGKPRAGKKGQATPLSLEKELDAVRAELAEAEANLQQTDAKVVEYRANSQELKRIDQTRPEAIEAVAKYQKQIAEAEKFRTALAQAEQELQQQQSRLKLEEVALQTRRQLIADVERINAELEKAAEKSTTADSRAELEQQQLEQLREERRQLEKKRTSLSDQRDALELAVQYLRSYEDRAELQQVHQQTQELQRELEQVRKAAAAISITEQQSARMEELSWDLQLTRSKLEAASATVTVKPGEGKRADQVAPVHVDGQEIDLAEPYQQAVTADMTFHVAGIELQVSPAETTAEWTEQIEYLNHELEKLSAATGVATAEEARSQLQQKKDYQQRIEVLQSSLVNVAGKHQFSELGAEIEQKEQQADRLLTSLKSMNVELADDLAGVVGGEEAESLAARLAQYQADIDAATTQIRELEQQLAQFAARIEAASNQPARLEAIKAQAVHTQLEEQLVAIQENLASAREAASDDDVEKAHAKANSAVVLAQAKATEAEAAWKETHIDDVEDLLEGATTQLKNLDRDESLLRDQQLKIEGWLSQTEGVTEKANQLRERQTRLERQLANARRKANAAQLLFETIQAARKRSHETIGKPLTDRMQQYAGSLFGSDVTFELTEDFAIESRHDSSGTFAFDALSGGAQEQIDILLRLAAAGLMDGNTGAPVIIDDALGYSDPQRLERMNMALSRAGRDSQVIVLTCHPERFARIGDAVTKRMTELVIS